MGTQLPKGNANGNHLHDPRGGGDEASSRQQRGGVFVNLAQRSGLAGSDCPWRRVADIILREVSRL
jgi:hypothetical protein